MFFYGLGFLMKEKQFDKEIFFIALVIYAISFAWPSMVDFQANSLTRGNAFLWYVYAPAAIVVFNYICKKVNYAVRPVTNIGRNSMWWFLAHWPVLCLSDIFYVNVCKISGGVLLATEFITVMSILALLHPLVNRSPLKSWI